jgi:hypothetical protein
MDVGRRGRDHNRFKVQIERFGERCGPRRFVAGRFPQPVVDVDENRLDAEGRLYPPQRGGQRERVAAAGESDNDPIVSGEPSGAGASQQALLEPVRRLPARLTARPRGRR